MNTSIYSKIEIAVYLDAAEKVKLAVVTQIGSLMHIFEIFRRFRQPIFLNALHDGLAAWTYKM